MAILASCQSRLSVVKCLRSFLKNRGVLATDDLTYCHLNTIYQHSVCHRKISSNARSVTHSPCTVRSQHLIPKDQYLQDIQPRRSFHSTSRLHDYPPYDDDYGDGTSEVPFGHDSPGNRYFSTSSVCDVPRKSDSVDNGDKPKSHSKKSFIDDILPVKELEIQEFLTDKGMHYEDGHTCYITACPRFMKKSVSFKRMDKMYINQKTGTSTIVIHFHIMKIYAI